MIIKPAARKSLILISILLAGLANMGYCVKPVQQQKLPVRQKLPLQQNLPKPKKIYGVIINTKGNVTIELDEKTVKPAKKGIVFSAGVTFVTKKKSEIEIIFADGSTVRAEQNTEFKIEKSEQVDRIRNIIIKLVTGRITSNTGKPTKFSTIKYVLNTPTAVVAIRGTIFAVDHDETRDELSSIAVFKGKVEVATSAMPDNKIVVNEYKQVSVSSSTKVIDPPQPISTEMKTYYTEVVKVFDKNTESYRKNVDLRHMIIEWMAQEQLEEQKKKNRRK
jgi:hypothetical protein